MKLDEIISLLGNFGRYQFFMVCYANVICIIGSLITFGDVFYAAETDHWCKVWPDENCTSWLDFQDNCTDVKKSIGLPPPERNDSKYPYSNCKQWDQPADYVFNPYLPFSEVENYTYHEVSCKNGWEYDTSQYKTTIISEFDLVCDDRSLPSLAQSIYFVGFLVGSFVCGSLSDWIGRKKTMFFGQVFFVVGSVVSTFSVNIYMYMAFRFLAGFGNIGAYIPLHVLVLEFVGQKWRSPVSFSTGISFAFGYFVMSVTAMYVREWRPLSLILSLTTVPIFVPAIFAQESIRWLLSKGRVEEAEAVIRKVAKINKKTLPDVLFDKEDIKEQMESKESPSVIDLYRTPNMAIKTINMQLNWLVNSLVYYGLSLSTGDLGVNDYWAFFMSGAVEIVGKFFGILSVEWFGRKWNLAILEFIAGVVCLATIFVPLGIWRTVVALAGKLCISVTFATMYLYTVELLPTPVRSVGLGVGSVASQLGSILSPIILLLGDYVPALPMILFSSSSIVAGFLALLLPETRGQRLPQTMEEGEEIGKCRCMRRDSEDQSLANFDEMDDNKNSVIAMTNPAFAPAEETDQP